MQAGNRRVDICVTVGLQYLKHMAWCLEDFRHQKINIQEKLLSFLYYF